MPTVPVPRVTGQTIAEAPMPGVRISGGNPDFGQSVGGALATAGVRAVAYEAKKQADADALTYSLAGRDQLDALHLKAMTPVELPDGSLDYAGPLKEYETQAQKVVRTVSAQAKHPLAQRATLDSLSSYAQAQRGKLASLAREQSQKNAQALAMNRVDTVLRDGTLSADERRNELLIAAKQYQVATGDPVEALKFFEKATRDGATFDWLSRVNAAESENDLDGLKKELLNSGRELGPSGMVQITTQIDRRRDDIVKMQERTQKAGEEAAIKALSDLHRDKKLTPSILESFRPLLPSGKYDEWNSRMTVQGTRGRDDPGIMQDFKVKIRRAWKDRDALISLRDRVATIASGYDPVTRTAGVPKLSQETESALTSEIEGYLSLIRSEGKDARSEKRGEDDRRFEAVRSIVAQKIQVQKAAAGAGSGEKVRVEKLEADLLEDLIRNRADPDAWLDRQKKVRPELFRPIPPAGMKSLIVYRNGGEPDFDATQRRIWAEYQAAQSRAGADKASTYRDYKANFDKLRRFREEWDASR